MAGCWSAWRPLHVMRGEGLAGWGETDNRCTTLCDEVDKDPPRTRKRRATWRRCGKPARSGRAWVPCGAGAPVTARRGRASLKRRGDTEHHARVAESAGDGGAVRRGWVHDGLAGETVAQAPVTRADGRLRPHALCDRCGADRHPRPPLRSVQQGRNIAEKENLHDRVGPRWCDGAVLEARLPRHLDAGNRCALEAEPEQRLLGILSSVVDEIK